MSPNLPAARSFTLLAGAVLALALDVSPLGPATRPATVHAQTALAAFVRRDFPLPDGHFYAQTNGRPDASTGYAITDGGGIPMWSEFQRLGGVAALGYPVTGRFVWDGFVVQATQRVVLQWHPELGQALFANTYDRLHDLGYDPWLEAFRAIPPPASTAEDAGLSFDQVRARHLAFLDADPAIRNAYFAPAPRGDPVAYNGLPMSPVVNAGPFTIVRCQRVTFQHWLVDDPASGAHAGDVDVTLGGDDAKASGAFTDQVALLATPPSLPQGPFIYGIQFHAYAGHAVRATTAVAATGFGWVKQQVQWRDVQPAGPGQQNWGDLDTIVDQANRRGLRVLLSVTAAPGWASISPTQPYPANPATLANFLSLLAARYRNRAGAYEIWNEQNFAREVGAGSIDAGRYVELLKAAYLAIKAVDPNAYVVSGAPTPTGVVNPNVAIDDNLYLQQMYAYQDGAVKQYFDALGVHAEPWANPPENTVDSPPPPNVTGFTNHSSFYFRRLEDYRATMVAAGDGDKPIWETEFGYDSCPPPYPVPPGYEYCRWVSEAQQADYLVRAFDYAHASYPWLGAIFVWNLNFQAVVPPTDEKYGFGILHADYSPRPAYTALQQMAKP